MVDLMSLDPSNSLRVDFEARSARQVRDRFDLPLVGTQAEGEAVSEVERIGDLVHATLARGWLILLLGDMLPAFAEAINVCRRWRAADGKAGPLDERTCHA